MSCACRNIGPAASPVSPSLSIAAVSGCLALALPSMNDNNAAANKRSGLIMDMPPVLNLLQNCVGRISAPAMCLGVPIADDSAVYQAGRRARTVCPERSSSSRKRRS
jgi:hypothetical protein